jgi:hypothetical protein
MIAGTAADAGMVWDEVAPLGELYTCYSSALAVSAAFGSPSWRAAVDGGLHLVIVEADELRFGFSHFPPGLARTLGLARRTADDPATAVAGILDELAANGRVIVAADGFNLPWHVAHGRRHVPHWFVLAARGGDTVVVDPFTCRNDLGLQQHAFEPLDARRLPALAAAVPVDDPVLALREAFALGADDRPLPAAAFRWLVHVDVPLAPDPGGFAGPAALRRLAAHFRDHAHRPDAYRQAEDLWSVGRHRAFFAHCVSREAAARQDEDLGRWAEEHAAAIVRRWGHVAPLLMQATLALEGGRAPTSSLPDTLDELAEREERAANSLPA